MIGKGVLKGMWVTLLEFIGTYPLGRWVLRVLGVQGTSGLVTIQYPDAKQQHPERFRYFPFLVYDDTPDNLRCVACKICEQECPPKCIFIEPARDEQGRPLKVHGRPFPKTFDIDTSICMQCRICVDVCPFDAIEMDKVYEMASAGRDEEMLYNKDQLLKSNEYFKGIRPVEAAGVDARLAAKAKKVASPAAGDTPSPAGTVPARSPAATAPNPPAA